MMQFRWPGFDSLRKLSPEEATEFAARVAELTKAGLPLGAGLRALADELPGRRLPRVLHQHGRPPRRRRRSPGCLGIAGSAVFPGIFAG